MLITAESASLTVAPWPCIRLPAASNCSDYRGEDWVGVAGVEVGGDEMS